MARSPRRDLIEATEVGVYHCVQRAVRRAWLCGQDQLSIMPVLFVSFRFPRAAS
jgi:hypothetical protein